MNRSSNVTASCSCAQMAQGLTLSTSFCVHSGVTRAPETQRRHVRRKRIQVACQTSVGQTSDDRSTLSRVSSLPPSFSDANFPVDDQGRTYHLGTKEGEVANRVLSVGSAKRAMLLSEFLDPLTPGGELFCLESSRGFITLTGLYRGVPVSIICTQMGMPNMDFVIRETRAVVEGKMAVVRLGTCGGLRQPAALGTVVIASPGSISVRRDPDAFTLNQAALLSMDATTQLFQPYQTPSTTNGNSSGTANGNGTGAVGRHSSNGSLSNTLDSHDALTPDPSTNYLAGPIRPYYKFTLPVPSDPQLSTLLQHELQFLLGEERVLSGMNASADSFYSSQGRIGQHFQDHNSDLIEQLTRSHPECVTLEMETFHLLDLARCTGGSIVAAAAAIVLAERHTNDFLDSHRLYLVERAAGLACLNALVKVQLPCDNGSEVAHASATQPGIPVSNNGSTL